MISKLLLLGMASLLGLANTQAQEPYKYMDNICRKISQKEFKWENKYRSLEIIKLTQNRYKLVIKIDSILEETIELYSNSDTCFFDGKRVVYYARTSSPTEFVVTTYSKGLIHGKRTWYSKKGDITKISQFKNGELFGYEIEYFRNGFIKCNGKYEKGRKIGRWVSYFPNYKVSTIGSYCAGLDIVSLNKEADSLVFTNERGDITKIMIFSDGKDSLCKMFNIDEWWTLAYPLELFHKDGEWKYFDLDGNLKRKEFYKEGELIGSDP